MVVRRRGDLYERLGPLLRRADQLAVGGLALLALLAMVGWWVARGGHRGDLIEIDRSERRSIEFVVDVNEADWPELAQLPGVGEVLARRIVESRAAEGPFQDLEQLRRVRGIGPKTLERMRGHLMPLPEPGTLVGR